MSEEMKRCPQCGEEILAIAKKCKHCNSLLGESIQADTVVAKSPVDYGMFLLAFPLVATLLIWFWVGSMNLLQSPGSTLSLIMIATVMGTAIIAAMEASKTGMKADKKNGTYSPTGWFFIIALLWIVGYPMYLLKRKYVGLASRVVPAVVVSLIFVGSYAIMSSAVDDRVEKVRGVFSGLGQ
jgi:hypothetical protein